MNPGSPLHPIPPPAQQHAELQDAPFVVENVIKMLHTLHSDFAKYNVADR